MPVPNRATISPALRRRSSFRAARSSDTRVSEAERDSDDRGIWSERADREARPREVRTSAVELEG